MLKDELEEVGFMKLVDNLKSLDFDKDQILIQQLDERIREFQNNLEEKQRR